MVKIRILAFLSGCILALLKAVYSTLKKILAVNIRNLLLGMRLQCTYSKEIASLKCSWLPDQESVPIMPAYIILDAQEHLYNYASIIHQGLCTGIGWVWLASLALFFFLSYM